MRRAWLFGLWVFSPSLRADLSKSAWQSIEFSYLYLWIATTYCVSLAMTGQTARKSAQSEQKIAKFHSQGEIVSNFCYNFTNQIQAKRRFCLKICEFQR